MIFILAGFNCYAQKEFADKINQTNSEGLKDGYWIERTNDGRIELYYKNGVRYGIYKVYSKNDSLYGLGEYRNGEMSGIWYGFGNQGHLMHIFKDFSKNTQQITYNSGVRAIPKFRCFATSYYPNGNIKDEGILLWDDDPELDTAVKFGLWKYYDESGKLIKTKEFK